MPPAPGEASRASASKRAWSTPSQRAIVSVTLVALSVHTSGRKRPVASAKPATAPFASAVGESLTVYTVPDVPSEIATSPGCNPSATAAAMLSPVPGATTASRPSAMVVPARSEGCNTRGSRGAQSTSSTIVKRSSAYSSRAAEK
jgi:hypothetical protein